MDKNSELDVAIEELYRVFGSYPRPKWFEGCGCCWNSRDVIDSGRAFTGGTVRIWAPGGDRALRDLAVEDLNEVAENVPHLGGDADVLRHYLPRLLEILVTTGFDWTDFEPALQRLNYTAERGGLPWWMWPEPEQRAVNGFLETAWAQRLRSPFDAGVGNVAADVLLCGIGTVVETVNPYLEKWLKFDEPHAAANLAEFLAWNTDLPNGRLANSFWGPDNARAAANLRRVVRWAHSQSTLLAVIAASDSPSSDSEMSALERCFTELAGGDAFGASFVAGRSSADPARRANSNRPLKGERSSGYERCSMRASTPTRPTALRELPSGKWPSQPVRTK